MLSSVRVLRALLLVVVIVTCLILALQPRVQKIKTESVVALAGPDIKGIIPSISGSDLVPDFASYKDVTAKKKAFFNYLLPEIKHQNRLVLKERDLLLQLDQQLKTEQGLTLSQLQTLAQLQIKYKVVTDSKVSWPDIIASLLIKVDIIPDALVLVQAANESGWGTSRFAQQGYNFFGLWCFRKGCGFVPLSRDEEAKHEVAKFRDLSHSVMTYIRNLNRLYAYHDLRQTRAELRLQGKAVTAEALATGLISYSQRGQDYIDELLAMLRVNKRHMVATL
jgi:Bax protein